LQRGLDGGLLELRRKNMPLQATDNIEIQSDKAWVVYDSKTGRIQHVHRVVTLKGGIEPNQSEIEDRAMDIAGKRGMTRSQLNILSVSPDQLHPSARHRVDPKKGSLVSEPVEEKDKQPKKGSK
jgi:hypothetical protein